MNEIRGGVRKRKFEVLNDLEYISITKNKISQLELDGLNVEKLNGKTWREFQHYLGDKIGIGLWHYNLKQKSSPEIHIGTIRSVTSLENKEVLMNKSYDETLSLLIDRVDKLAKSKSEIGIDILLQSQKAGFEAQISYLEIQIKDKDKTITVLEKEIDELENEIEKLERIKDEIEKKSGWTAIFKQYEPLIAGALTKMGAKTKTPVLSAQVNGDHDIPNEIISILAQVDYYELKKQPEEYNKILNYLQQYVSILPQKNV